MVSLSGTTVNGLLNTNAWVRSVVIEMRVSISMDAIASDVNWIRDVSVSALNSRGVPEAMTVVLSFGTIPNGTWIWCKGLMREWANPSRVCVLVNVAVRES